jgi:hypothetical protein
MAKDHLYSLSSEISEDGLCRRELRYGRAKKAREKSC